MDEQRPGCVTLMGGQGWRVGEVRSVGGDTVTGQAGRKREVTLTAPYEEDGSAQVGWRG